MQKSIEFSHKLFETKDGVKNKDKLDMNEHSTLTPSRKFVDIKKTWTVMHLIFSRLLFYQNLTS